MAMDIDFWREGRRKITLVYFFGILGAIMFLFSDRGVAAMGAVFALWGTLIGWYNESNVREHRIKNGGTNGK
jgi:hypothetical protein